MPSVTTGSTRQTVLIQNDRNFQILLDRGAAWCKRLAAYELDAKRQFLPFPSLPFPSLPFPSLPFPSLPFPSLPFPSLPFPSLPFPSLHLACLPAGKEQQLVLPCCAGRQRKA